ncbi:hypothetical protein SLH49_02825 [Cognatiyoonia sp. IB215446]|uniref:hypothetical protein n=1 Tax=Cognatiyoonia sp. IB215446 TaxID=3097355 RepID=UPI002A0E0154|nr:hypothetical protein [Cognatiyoonia sp. IB215446]MDX8346909.1 hypothetical protein [Cognatiyoonia sp. IB215446]
MNSMIDLKKLELTPSLGIYGPDNVAPDAHLLDRRLTIDPSLTLINADRMNQVFD